MLSVSGMASRCSRNDLYFFCEVSLDSPPGGGTSAGGMGKKKHKYTCKFEIARKRGIVGKKRR